MAQYSPNDEGVEAMRTMAGAVRDAIEEIGTQTEQVQSTADGHNNVLGPHKASLDDVLDSVRQSIKAGTDPAEAVADTLDEVADDYEEIIAHDRFKKSGN